MNRGLSINDGGPVKDPISLAYSPMYDEDVEEIKWCNRRSQSKACCYAKRWKIICSALVVFLIVFVVVLAVGGVIGDFLVAPKVAQHVIDESGFNFVYIQLDKPQNDTFILNGSATLKSDFFYHGSIKIQESNLYLYYGDVYDDTTVIGYTILPETDVQVGSSKAISIVNPFQISNMSNFRAFGRSVILSDKVYFGLKAHPTVQFLHFLHVDVDISKNLSVAGAGDLKNMSITLFDLTHSNKTNVNIIINTTIYNPAIVTISPLNSVTFSVFAPSLTNNTLYFMGNVTSDPVSGLGPGANTIVMRGSLTPSNLDVFGNLISRYFTGIDNKLVAQVVGCQDKLWCEILDGIMLETILPGNKTQLISQTDIMAMTVIPLNNSFVSITNFTFSLKVVQLLGTVAEIDFETIVLNVDLLYLKHNENGTEPSWIDIGRISSEKVFVGSQGQTVITLTINETLLDIGATPQITQNFEEFMQDLVQKPNLEVRINGTVDAVTKLVFGQVVLNQVPVDVSTFVTGGDNLHNVSILHFELFQITATNASEQNAESRVQKRQNLEGVGIDIEAQMYNPTIGSMKLGNVSFWIEYEGEKMGYVSVDDLFFVPGYSNISFYGLLNPFAFNPGSNTVSGKISTIVSNYINGQGTELTVKGNNVSFAGGNNRDNIQSVEWLNELIQALEINSTLPAYSTNGTAFDPVTGIEIAKIAVYWDAQNVIKSDFTVILNYTVPFSFYFEFLEFTANITFSYLSTPFIMVSFPQSAITSNWNTSQIIISLTDIPITVLDFDVFSEFLTVVITSPTVPISVLGVGNTTLNSGMGNVTLSNLRLGHAVNLSGVDSFKGKPISLFNPQVVYGVPGKLVISVTVQVYNPAVASIAAGPATLGVLFENQTIAYIDFDDFVVNLGWNNYSNQNVKVIQTAENSQAVSDFLSLYARGINAECELYGVPNVTIHPVLAHALTSFKLTSSVPGLPQKIILSARIVVNIIDFLKGYIVTELTVHNPFAVDAVLQQADLKIYFNETYVGKLQSTDLNVFIKKSSTSVTKPVEIKIEGFTWEEFRVLVGNVLLNVDGTILGDFDQGFIVDYYYSQDNIPTGFDKV